MARPRDFDEQVVIEKAMESFWTHGYAGTSPALLASATGLGKGSLYNAFTSKRGLFDLCLEAYQERVRDMATELLATPGSTKECLCAALYAIIDADLAEPQLRGCLIGNTAVELAGEDRPLAARLKKMQDESTTWFADRIRRGQVEGDVSVSLDAQQIADYLATVLAGLRVMAMTQDAKTLHRTIDAALEILS